MTARKSKILISGLGVAGSTLGWWLVRQGFEVTIVERTPAPRTGGYMIDFWGPGYEVAERMGVIDVLRADSYAIDRLRLIGPDGRDIASLDMDALDKILAGRFFSLLRSDLANGLYRCVRDNVEILFDDQIQRLAPRENAVDVAFEQARGATFDLVVGADGVHSPVRRRLFDETGEYPLDYWSASFSTSAYPHRDRGAYVSFTKLGRQVARYALRDNRTAFLFVFRHAIDPGAPPRTVGDQKAYLRRIYGDDGWECGEILARLDDCEDLYFDDVVQVRAPAWSKGRIALVGDAAYCPSLLAGEGASLAMAGAMVLAGELGRCRGDHAEAFLRYERHLRRSIERKQRRALLFGGWFAPRTSVGLLMRNSLSRIAAIPGLTAMMVGPMVSSDINLPHYPVG